jgi:hypothetical protein
MMALIAALVGTVARECVPRIAELAPEIGDKILPE